MQNPIFPVLIIIIGCLLAACSSSSTYHKDDVYNPHTQQAERHSYTPYYQLKTDIIPEKLEMILVTHLNKETIPGAYSLKKFTRRLLPNDYMAQSDVMLYLNNLSNQPVELDLIAISVEQKRLPYSAKTLTIPENESLSWHLGQIGVDLRLTTLNTRIEYITEEHQEKEFDMKRIIRDTKVEKNNINEQYPE